MRVAEQLIEYESMLHESVQRVGRAVRNLRQEVGGFPSTTPGNGSPGGGKGGRPTVRLADPSDPVDPDGCDVAITSVESQVLFGDDPAGDKLDQLDRSARLAVDRLGIILTDLSRDPGPDWTDRRQAGADRLTVLAYARLRRVAEPPSEPDRHLVDDLEAPVADIFHICQTWGYDLHRPAVPKDRAELLAVDLTGTLCRSHLRVGERRDRDRGEFCQWCRKFEALEGFIPPVELVRIHVEFGRVRDDQIKPHRQAHQNRQRQMVKRR